MHQKAPLCKGGWQKSLIFDWGILNPSVLPTASHLPLHKGGLWRKPMEHKRLTLFAGHYGSGKTNIAVNYALYLAKEGKKVCIADLDIVNPYFRT